MQLNSDSSLGYEQHQHAHLFLKCKRPWNAMR